MRGGGQSAWFADDPPERFQILALDGGGVKALFTVYLLARLEDDLGVSIRDTFDLIAGTSAGGIIALALGAGKPPAEIVDHYEQLTATVFPASRRRRWRLLASVLWPRYRQGPLRSTLEGVLGDRPLGDSDKRLVIPACDVEQGEVRLFKTPHHPRLVRDWKIPMVEVALATSAAPIYLPAAKVDGQRLVDGGLWANNPSVVAITEAYSMLGVPLESLRVLSIGTTDELTDHPRRLDKAGVGFWAPRVAQLTMKTSGKGASGVAEHLVGPERYKRVDPKVPAGLHSLDRADSGRLAALESTVSLHLSPVFDEHFAGHTAHPYEPDVSETRRHDPG